jgi:hypothetical protein
VHLCGLVSSGSGPVVACARGLPIVFPPATVRSMEQRPSCSCHTWISPEDRGQRVSPDVLGVTSLFPPRYLLSWRTCAAPMAIGNDGGRRREIVDALRKMLQQQLRQIQALERACERTIDEILIMAQALDEMARSGTADGITIPTTPRPKRARREVSWFASKVILTAHGPSAFVVGDVKHTARLTQLQMELVSVLAAGTREGQDALVGFKKLDTIVHALQTKYKRPQTSRRSVVVAISRLREALGSNYRDLVEWRPGLGYRLRVMPG